MTYGVPHFNFYYCEVHGGESSLWNSVTHHPAVQISHSLSGNEQGRNLFCSVYDTSFQLLSGC